MMLQPRPPQLWGIKMPEATTAPGVFSAMTKFKEAGSNQRDGDWQVWSFRFEVIDSNECMKTVEFDSWFYEGNYFEQAQAKARDWVTKFYNDERLKQWTDVDISDLKEKHEG